MAQRRMMSLKIVDTDAFMDMPLSSQALYLHMLIRADDDGFIANPKKIMRMIGCQDDDIKILITKKFILPFESGVCVIKHWRIHNLIRSDRYNETNWAREKELLVIDKKTGKYSLNSASNNVIPDGNHLAPQVRLGKVRLGKDNTVQFAQFWSVYPIKKGKQKAEEKWDKIDDSLYEEIIEHVKVRAIKDKQWLRGYIPHPTTFLNQALWEDEYEVEEQGLGIINLNDIK